MKLLKTFIFCISSILFSVYGHAQEVAINGKVLDDKGLPIPGATILLKGSAIFESSNFDGKFQIKAPKDGTLIISFIGCKTVQEPINGRTELQIKLNSTAQDLNEVVVVGYGVQKRSNVTGSVSSLKAKAFADNPNTAVGQILQGRVSGVTVIANSGEPGAASTIRVRGITTFNSDQNGNNPLWVVDGIIVDNGGIGSINQSDIESLEVLKDAASLAIYGSRSASGVILITTKKGKLGKINVSYSGFAGSFSPAKKLDLLNATQYATIMNEKSVAGGGGLIYTNPAALGAGTDWQSTIFNSGSQRSSHEISFSGGNEVSSFYSSIGYQDQQGIVATDISNYKKLNMRLNSTHKISKIFTIGESVGYAHDKSQGIGNTNSEFGGPLSSAINLDPTTPTVVTDPTVANVAPYSTNPVVRDANGNPYGISSVVGQEITNPLAYIQTRLGNYRWSDNLLGNAYVQIKPINDFVFKASFGGKLSTWGEETFTPKAFLNSNNNVTENSLYRSNNRSFGWNVENTLTYAKQLGNHNIVVLLGQGAYEDYTAIGSTVTYQGLPVNNFQDASFNWDIPASKKTGTASAVDPHRIESLFARLNYNFKEKYLLTGVIRRDGSTNFGTNNKYGVFPAVSGGWVVSKEEFWKENSIVNSLKLRGNYGLNGNDAIEPNKFVSNIIGGSNYNIGNPGTIISGYGPDSPANPDLKWESTTSADIGFDATLFNDFNMGLSLYNKKTSDILQVVEIPGYVGSIKNPVGNVADMVNKGVDFELGYHHKFGELNFSANGNLSYVENKVTYLGGGKDFITDRTARFQSMGDITRTAVGQTYNSFYGFQTAGIFQTQEEINAYTNAAGTPIQPAAKPGDFRWVDNNHDGKINDDDKTFIGNSLPAYNYGLTLNLDYKGFDFQVFFQGASKYKIFQGLRRLDVQNANYQTKALGRWTGEGTSNDYPRLTSNDTNGNFEKSSDFYLENGDYLRLKLMTLGYSLPEKVISQIGATKVRIYVTGQNLLTFTKYTGYDPEIGGDISGVDKGLYPQAKGFIFGANLQF
ncbi:TonB-dependent receptor [Flavobacterium sp. ZT3R18]|uniref:SusC/RagA family TonB-linked outer membrane protein n=1 Tax=Flavobacterium sp. ZT3R18 TaxID=2594429 RepID=UPI00117AFEEC|nr:TonB-dependent receptor [Flavobacterium sp. ZT3R18]TRX35471.1 TonB-dependent receptor [Flavobacterium sp. ZT3R18]